MKSILTLIVVLCIQIIVYLLIFRSHIIKWGATAYEVAMPMPGDNYAGYISSTRAVAIHKPAAYVWTYLVDMGADRKGYYSYYFLERLLGCKITKQIKEKNRELRVGRLIPYTSPDSEGNYTEGFHVIEVEQGRSFVLKEWGSFLINKVDKNNSRLIIRTFYSKPHNMFDRFYYSIFDALHHIMEKRMLLGIKDLAESNGEFSSIKDWIWFLGILISGSVGLLLVFVFQGYSKFILPTIFITIWQFSLLVLNPRPFNGIVLVVLVGAIIFLHRTFLKNKN
jgi:hypothetical protein